MERREDIRAAMRSLLSPSERPEARARAAQAEDAAGSARPEPLRSPSDSGSRMCTAGTRVLLEMQNVLRDHGIVAETEQLAQAIWGELAARPSLCRGLLAAYLLRDV